MSQGGSGNFNKKASEEYSCLGDEERAQLSTTDDCKVVQMTSRH